MTHQTTERNVSKSKSTSSAGMDQCIENCLNCHRACLEAIAGILNEKSTHDHRHLLASLQDCVDICQTSANFMIRGSHMHMETCGACAPICEHCAKECGEINGHEFLKKCAEACAKCAESCGQMAKMKV